jgi:tetratricopeptide (TPR) repeat protein
MRQVLSYVLAAILSTAGVAIAQQRALVQDEAPLEARGLVALAIGNANYGRSPLKNPVNDARAMSAALKDLGFAVELTTDADYHKLGASIDRFVSRLRRGDVAVFYYAGHGMQIEGENYLVPTDFDAQDEAAAKYAAYPADRLLEGMERSGAKLNIIILDACRNNPYRGARAMGGGLAPMGSGTGTFVAFATSPGKTASDNSRSANGLFTTYLLDSLQQPGLTLDDVFNRTREQVYASSNQAQTPWTQSNVIGRFYFRPDKAVAASALQRPQATAPRVMNISYRDGVRDARFGEPANAVDAFTQTIRQDPDNMEAYYERAMTYATLGQFQHAIEDFGKVILRNPNDTNALIGRGASYINVGDYDRAVADLDRVLQKERQNDVAFFDRGLANAGLARHRQAIDDYGQVIRRRPKWPTTWYNRGIVYAASGDFRAAISDYTEAIRLRPDYSVAYANRGVTHAELSELPQALADLDQAIRLQPGDAAMLNSRGMVRLSMKNTAQALEDFDEAIRLNPLLAVAYSNRAEARQALGDSAGAQTDLTRARELGAR